MNVSPPANRWFLALLAALALVALFLVTRHRAAQAQRELAAATANQASAAVGTGRDRAFRFTRLPHASGGAAPADAAAMVREKLAQFSDSRLELARALAASKHVTLSPQAEAFFAAVKAGDWEAIERLYKELVESRPEDGPEAEGWQLIKCAAKEAYGAAEAAHAWPPDRLLQYGEAVLGALRPGMVYIGGTDPGRFIPTLLNETSGGERHVVLTQNALADASYLEYVRFQYSDRLALLDGADSQRSFGDYIKDAKARALHDEQFPEAPAQLRPGEQVRVTEGRVQVSGQTAVMAINEKLLTALLDKNPGVGFALEESFSLPSTYTGAAPAGALLELRAGEAGRAVTPEQAAQSIEFWRTAQQDLATEPPDSEVRKAWAKMAVAQSNLLARQGFAAEAEQGYGLARALAPTLPEAIHGLVALWEKDGRGAEAASLRRTLPAGK